MRRIFLSMALLAAAPAFAQAPAESFQAPQEDPKDVVGAPRGTALAGAALDARTEEVGSLLRCPVCQGLSIADSPASMAQKMKARVRELLAAGYDQEQILAYFERSYGEFVRLEPPRRGINWLVWLSPPVVLGLGALLIRRALRQQRAPAARGAEFTSAESAGGLGGATTVPPSSMTTDPDLASYVLRVREMAYGWPGGRPPSVPS